MLYGAVLKPLIAVWAALNGAGPISTLLGRVKSFYAQFVCVLNAATLDSRATRSG